MKIYRLLFASFVIGVASASAWPAGWGAILKGGAVEDFTDEDLHFLVDAIRQTFAAAADSAPVQWRNPASGAGGSLHVIGRPERGGFDECRRVRMTLYSAKRKGLPFNWTACRQTAGRWLLVGAD